MDDAGVNRGIPRSLVKRVSMAANSISLPVLLVNSPTPPLFLSGFYTFIRTVSKNPVITFTINIRVLLFFACVTRFQDKSEELKQKT